MKQQSKPLVSVIIPYFNAEKTLERAARSILVQTFSDLELILVDNNSSDQSIYIARQLAAEDDRALLLHEKKQGVSHAANTGNATARGKYIARMDADDYAYPERIHAQVKLLENNPRISVASCLVGHVGHHEETKGLESYTKWTNSLVSPEEIALNRFIESPVINPTLLFRRELLDMYGNYQHGDFPEDYELLLRWLGKGVRIQKIEQVLLDWHDSDTRLTRSDRRYRPDAFYKTKAQYLSKWMRYNDRPYFWVWGAGRISRKRVDFLINQGLFIEGFIDVKERQLPEYPCIHFNQFNWQAPSFILSYVGNRGVREEIRAFLNAKGKEEGVDYLLIA